jgi:hypothetical protein
VERFSFPAILNILKTVDINLQNNKFITYRLHQIKGEWAGQLASTKETITRKKKLKGTQNSGVYGKRMSKLILKKYNLTF